MIAATPCLATMEVTAFAACVAESGLLPTSLVTIRIRALPRLGSQGSFASGSGISEFSPFTTSAASSAPRCASIPAPRLSPLRPAISPIRTSVGACVAVLEWPTQPPAPRARATRTTTPGRQLLISGFSLRGRDGRAYPLTDAAELRHGHGQNLA